MYFKLIYLITTSCIKNMKSFITFESVTEVKQKNLYETKKFHLYQFYSSLYKVCSFFVNTNNV